VAVPTDRAAPVFGAGLRIIHLRQAPLLDCSRGLKAGSMHIGQAADRANESFRGLLLRYRGRAGLTQLDLVARLGASRRAIQDWESGVSHPSAKRLQGLIVVLLEAGGLTAGREALEGAELWASVLRETPRMRTPLRPDVVRRNAKRRWGSAERPGERTAPARSGCGRRRARPRLG
jgi:transcriptional regulator with XRE-family HTH domain